MKGIVHFISGVAAASFIPAAVASAERGSLVLALAGACALLPDTLDFKFVRYFERLSDEIAPTEASFDAQAIADRIAAAMQAAFETGQPKTVQLHTVRLGGDLWRRYAVRFSPETNEVIVRPGPAVNTSQMPYPDSELPGAAEGRATVGVLMTHTYDADTHIDILSGPCFRFERRGDAVHVTFLPWHRRWTHSLALAVALGMAGGLLLGPVFGAAIALGVAVHLLEDQLGFMGSNLLWPFTRQRTQGLRLIRSGDPIPNFLTVWVAVALTLFNLDRFSAEPRLPTLPYLLLAVALPAVLMLAVYVRQRRKEAQPLSPEGLRQADIVAETEEIEL
jgi:membrane-bound metal-dependent hydrolase YbcI (DUF457 family)